MFNKLILHNKSGPVFSNHFAFLGPEMPCNATREKIVTHQDNNKLLEKIISFCNNHYHYYSINQDIDYWDMGHY